MDSIIILYVVSALATKHQNCRLPPAAATPAEISTAESELRGVPSAGNSGMKILIPGVYLHRFIFYYLCTYLRIYDIRESIKHPPQQPYQFA